MVDKSQKAESAVDKSQKAESVFVFNGFKIDNVSLKVLQSLFVLNAPHMDGDWEIKLKVRKPIQFVKHNTYVSGIDLLMSISIPKDQLPADQTDGNLVSLGVGIAGSFSVQDGALDAKKVENLVKIQFPLLLFPYLRSAVTSILASAGFGGVILPLVNLHEMAKNQLADLEIEKID